MFLDGLSCFGRLVDESVSLIIGHADVNDSSRIIYGREFVN